MAGLPVPGSVAGGAAAMQLDLQAIQSNKVKIQTEKVGLIRDQLGLMQEMRAMQLWNNIKPGQAKSPADLANVLDQVSLIQLESGQFDKGAQTAAKASGIRNQASAIEARKFKIRQQKLQQFANVLGGVPDTPAGYQQALLTMVQTDPHVVHDPQFAQLMQTPWRPGLVGQLKSMVLDAKDKSLIAYHKTQQAKAQEDIKMDQARMALMQKEKKYLSDRDKTLAKAGVQLIKSNELQAITDQATRDFPGADPADIRVRSRPIAEQMLQLMRQEHLTLSEAAVKAYQQAKKDGVFNGLRKMPTLKGTSAKNPLPMPYKDAQEAAADNYKRISDNMWYLVNGVPMVALAGHFYTQQELDAADKENALLGGQ